MDLDQALLDRAQQKDYVPLTIDELAAELNLKGGQLAQLRKAVKRLVGRGTLAKVKGDRYCLPRDADLVSGNIRFRQSGSAWMVPDHPPNQPPPEDYQIDAEDTHVALHGDRVLVRIKQAPSRPRYQRGRRVSDAKAQDQQYARVIRILERKRQTFTGTLQKTGKFFYVVPDDPRIVNDILVPDPKDSPVFPPPKLGEKVVVRLLEWTQRHLNPQGEIIETLGKTHTPGAEYKALLHKFDLNPEFPEAVLKEVNNIPGSVPKKERKGRRDIREVFTFTIDPDDSKDFDDALSLEELDNGDRRIGVHIADVSAYVKTNTALDKEAHRRGNSTYLVGVVIPMLPHALSNGICSLVEGEDRLTKSVFLTFAPNGKLKETDFANTVIRSDKRLTYRQAYALLQETSLEEVRATPLPPKHQTGSTGRSLSDLSNGELNRLRDAIRKLWGIGSKLRAARFKGGSLDLDMPETKIYVDEEGWADRIESVTNDESHQLIEEFMLAANEAVARALHGDNIPYISRVHDEPDPDKLNDLREYLATVGIEVGDLTHRPEVNKFLARIKDHPQGYTLRIQFLRSMKAACYRASADGHYGLNKQYYAHFTSPIRRYADLLVHRIFDGYLSKHGHETAPKRAIKTYKRGELDSMAEHISITEQNSTEAERESVKIKLLEFFERELQKRERTAFEAIITEVRNHGMFVELRQSLAFGLVHISTLRDDLYRLDEDGTSLVGRRRRKRYTVGQTVPVTVDRVDRFKRQIDFVIADQPSGQPARKGDGKASGKKKKRGRGGRQNKDRGSGQSKRAPAAAAEKPPASKKRRRRR